MTSFNAALNYPFASAEALRQVFAERGADDAVAAQLKQAANNQPFQIGSTITARYQYKVAPDGSLVPTSTQITAEQVDDATAQQQGRRSRAFRDEDDKRSLRDYSKPKAELTPSDEVGIFATDGLEAGATIIQAGLPSESEVIPVSPIVTSKAEVLDENGQPVEAEILNASGQLLGSNGNSAAAKAIITAQAQYNAANLYARNSNIAYNVTPLSLLAA